LQAKATTTSTETEEQEANQPSKRLFLFKGIAGSDEAS